MRHIWIIAIGIVLFSSCQSSKALQEDNNKLQEKLTEANVEMQRLKQENANLQRELDIMKSTEDGDARQQELEEIHMKRFKERQMEMEMKMRQLQEENLELKKQLQGQ